MGFGGEGLGVFVSGPSAKGYKASSIEIYRDM